MFVCRQSATTTTGGCVDDIYITRAVVWARLICICMICIVSSYRHMHKLQLLPWMGPRPLFSTWWRHQMEAFSALLRPVTRSFDIFFALHLNKRLSKQSWVWWFETPSLSLWSHCSVNGHVLSLDLGAARFEVNPTCRYFFRKPKAQVWCTVWTARTCSQYRGGCWPGDARSQVNSYRGVDLVLRNIPASTPEGPQHAYHLVLIGGLTAPLNC